MVDTKLISCKTNNITIVGLVKFEICEEEIATPFRRDNTVFRKKIRRIYLNKNMFPISPGIQYLITVIGDAAMYYVKVYSWETNIKDEWEWIIHLP